MQQPAPRVDVFWHKAYLGGKPKGPPQAIEVIKTVSSEPHADVPAYVCLPSDAAPPDTFFICLRGHSTFLGRPFGFPDYSGITPPIPIARRALACAIDRLTMAE
jgi:hypothetical protein